MSNRWCVETGYFCYLLQGQQNPQGHQSPWPVSTVTCCERGIALFEVTLAAPELLRFGRLRREPARSEKPTPGCVRHRCASLHSELPARSSRSVLQSSGSAGPATPASLAGSPTGLSETPLVVLGQLPAVISSCSAGLYGAPLPATEGDLGRVST